MQRARFTCSQAQPSRFVARWALVFVLAVSVLAPMPALPAAAAPAHAALAPAEADAQSASSEVDPRASQVQVSGPHRADGSEQATITVTLRDAAGTPVPGKQILIISSGTQNSMTGPLSRTDANGVASATMTSTMPEAKTIQAIVVEATGALHLSQTPLIEFTGAAISGAVFLDDDGDAQFDDDEQRIAGVLVRLYADGAPTPLHQLVTTGDGYRFSGLLPGSYRIVAAPLSGYSASGAQETTVAVEAFAVSGDHNFARIPSAQIHGQIWTDGDQDGQQDSGEEGLANASVTVTGPTGATQTITSDASGSYQASVPAPLPVAPGNQSFTAGGHAVQEPLTARIDNASFDRLGAALEAANSPENASFATRGYALDTATFTPNSSFNDAGYPLDPATYPENASFSTLGYALDATTLPTKGLSNN